MIDAAGTAPSLPHGDPPATTTSTSTSPSFAARGDSVAEEAALLRAAHAALARGDGDGALARLDEHAARFPRGALGEEERAARVFALCASGRKTEARALAASFVAASPRSPLAAQVRRSCTESSAVDR